MVLRPSSPKLDMKLQHRNWRLACAEAFEILSMAEPGEVVCITGPSRIGKTRLIAELIELLCGPSTFHETGLMPAVVVDAENSAKNGTFSTKSFMESMLEAIQHPIMFSSDDLMEDALSVHKVDKMTESTLRRILVKGFKYRGTAYLFIDESQHVSYAGKDVMAARGVMDSWKCLAKKAGVVLVLVGAYPILNIIAKGPHLIGRKHQVHFPRYYFDDNDFEEFGALLLSYEESLTLSESLPTLLESATLLYEGTFGCIGLLRAWLGRADAYGRVHGTGITRFILEKTMLSEADRDAIWEEIEAGEKILASNTLSKDEVNQKSKQKAENRVKNITEGKRKNSKPFQRKPSRMKPGNRTKGAGNVS